jgi:transcriptional regulator with XRE-family HTH domain
MCSVDENKDVGQTFGTSLREQREQQGLTLRKFAELCGVAASYVSNIESDTMPPPSVPIIERMASVLNLRSNVLLVRAGKLSKSTLTWFWSQPATVDLLSCASGLNESLAQMYVITSLTQLERSQDSA